MALQVATGTYTGNGTSLAITGLGFQPKFLIIGANALQHSQIAMDTFTAANAGDWDGSVLATTRVSSLDAGGFTVGASATTNGSAVAHYYLAIGGTADIFTGTYTGNGTSQTISAPGFQPAFVNIYSTVADAPVFRTSIMATDSASRYHTGGTATGAITSLTSTGFTVGASADTNTSTTVYHYVAIKANSLMDFKSYTGTGASNTVTGLAITPTFVMIKDQTTTGNTAVWSNSSMAGSGRNTSAHGLDATMVTAFGAGSFTVGTSGDTNGLSDSYQAYAFAAGTASSGATPTAHNLSLMGRGI